MEGNPWCCVLRILFAQRDKVTHLLQKGILALCFSNNLFPSWFYVCSPQYIHKFNSTWCFLPEVVLVHTQPLIELDTSRPGRLTVGLRCSRKSSPLSVGVHVSVGVSHTNLCQRGA